MKKILPISIILIFILIGGYYINKSTIDNKDIEIPTLMYHHFDDDRKNINDMTVQTSEFEKQIKYLKENGYTAISLSDLNDFIENKKRVPKKPILITIDDGYKSNYDIMYPIIKKYKMKATIFVIGERIDNANKKSNAISKFNWKQAKEMYDSNIIDIECHTYDSHKRDEIEGVEKSVFANPLPNESNEDFKQRIIEDVKKNIYTIQKNIGYTPIALAYPYGEFNEEIDELLKDMGIKYTFLASGGKETKMENKHLLKRIPVNGCYSINEFKNMLN